MSFGGMLTGGDEDQREEEQKSRSKEDLRS